MNNPPASKKIKSAAIPNSAPELALLMAIAGLLLITPVGCARFHSKPLSASANADALESRSLTNANVEIVLKKNLLRDFDNWPAVEWDFNMLALAAFYYHPSLQVARAQWAIIVCRRSRSWMVRGIMNESPTRSPVVGDLYVMASRKVGSCCI